MNFATLLICALLVFLSLCLYLKWKYTYWKRVGIEYFEPSLFWGNVKCFDKKQFLDNFINVYRAAKRKGYKQIGYYFLFQPLLIAVDLDFIKNILHRDFEHFVNHGFYINEEFDPLSGHLFALEDDKWRRLKQKLSPALSIGKLKMMYSTLYSCTNSLKDVLEEYAKIQDAVDIKDVVSRFTIDIIGSVGFGLECNSLKDANSVFRDKARKLYELTFIQRCKEMTIFTFPKKVLEILNIKFFSEEVETFFTNVIRDTVNYRETNNVYRKDFMHLLLQLKNRGKIADDEFITKQDGEEEGTDYITFNELAAQCIVFFMAGFETSATTMTFALLELAIHQDIQDKVRDELTRAAKKYNGDISYDALMELKYLDKVVYETLRKHPPAPNIPRQCTKTYTIPETGVIIEKGVRLLIPIIAIQNDPEVYQDPDKFDPERFNEENKAKIHPAAFLAFGDGPRYCLGTRLALMQTKVGLAKIISNFRVNVHQKTQLPITYVNERFTLAVDGGVWLTVSKLH